MKKVITIRDLNLKYGKNTILRNLSMQVEQGDFFIVIGPNGAGKTSLLKVISGIERAINGEVAILGRGLAEYSRKKLSQKVALVPQHMTIDFPYTVAETVLMGRSPHLSLLGLEQDRDIRIAEQAMLFTDVAHLAARRLDQLSGGEIQRVIIARAICQQPEIILLDEPTAALDPAHQMKVMDLMERLRQEQGVTVVMVSHDLNLAAMYGDRLLLMKEGAAQKTGRPEEVLTEPELEKGYGCRMMVDENPCGSGLRVMPVPEKYQSKGIS